MDAEDLLSTLRRAVERCVAGADHVAVAYSGGLDSSITRALASGLVKTTCYTCGTPGSYDHGRADELAVSCGGELKVIALDHADLALLVREAGRALGTDDPVRISYTVPVLCVVMSSAHEVVLVGSGADELFGGYSRYLQEEDPEAAMARDLGKMLGEWESLRTHCLSIGRRVESPFVDPDVIALASGLPLERKVHRGVRKVILRDVAGILGLEARDAPKKAAQYSSGVMKQMKDSARSEGKSLGDWTAEKVGDGRGTP